MTDFRIFTESPADIKFIGDFIDEHFHIQLPKESYDVLNSWSGYKEGGRIKSTIQQNFDLGKQTILILDADKNFETRKLEVETDFKTFGVPINLFLSPNNSGNGNLENLLCQIAVKQDILKCFEAYEACIQGYEAPVIKSKIFAYLDALLPEKNKKNNKHDLLQAPNRNYRNTAHWDLHHAYLQPLKDFLTPFFK